MTLRKALLLTGVLAVGYSATNVFAFSFFDKLKEDPKQIISENYTEKVDTSAEVKAFVPKEEEDKVTSIISNVTQNTKEQNIDDTSIVNQVIDATTKSTVDNVVSKVKIFKVSNDYITLPIDNLDVDKYSINIYYSTIFNDTKLSEIQLVTNNGIKTFDVNLSLVAGQKVGIGLSPDKVYVTVDGKVVYTTDNTSNGEYTEIKLKVNKVLAYNGLKVNYIGSDYLDVKNKLIVQSDTLHNDDITKTADNVDIIGDNNIVMQNVTKKIVWDKEKGKFVIQTTTNNQTSIKLNLSPDLKVKDGLTVTDILNNLDTAFDGLTFVSKDVNFDGNNNTIELIYKDNAGKYYVYQLSKNVVNDGTNQTIEFTLKKIYEGNESHLTNMTNIELDGDTNTKEWYYQDKNYAIVLQYKDGLIRRVLYQPGVKIYFNNLLTKNGVQWKVLFALKLADNEVNGKKYVTPFIELFWFDNNKQKYYPKQVQDYTSFDTFNIKMDGNYIYKKDSGTVDYNNTDYLN